MLYGNYGRAVAEPGDPTLCSADSREELEQFIPTHPRKCQVPECHELEQVEACRQGKAPHRWRWTYRKVCGVHRWGAARNRQKVQRGTWVGLEKEPEPGFCVCGAVVLATWQTARGSWHMQRACVTCRMRKVVFGVSPEVVVAMLEAQDWVCAMADCTEPVTLSSHLDHDRYAVCGHSGRKGCPACVRGMLCQTCNLRLGAWEYAEHHRKQAFAEYVRR